MTREIIKKAILHKGYALVDIFQPCVSFNKTNTYKWFKDNTYPLEDSYDPGDRIRAFEKAVETAKFPLGVIYANPEKATFEESLSVYSEDSSPVIRRKRDLIKLQQLIDQKTA
jgi:2-oxoglutarate ferredoxin oxidoreductase subunit beta